MASGSDDRKYDISVIVPLYNEEENVRILFDAVSSVLQAACFDYEIIMVDDGSTDRTANLIFELSKENDRVRFVPFRRNFGQTAAMSAGIDLAQGRVLVTMDGDMQNDPRDIPKLVAGIKEGYDIVVGWRVRRQDKLLTRKGPSRVANWIIAKVTGVPIHDNGCSLKAYRAEIIKEVPLYSEMHRFIPAMSTITGARIKEVPVRHHARKFGTSKYGLGRIHRVMFDLLTIKTIITFTARPLLWFSLLSIPVFFVSALFMGFLLRQLWLGESSTIVFAGLAMIFGSLGAFLIVCGALGELVYSTGDVRFSRLPSLTARRYPPHSGAAP
jgi:glycosyltransferase involved in cell wall biosynthesis